MRIAYNNLINGIESTDITASTEDFLYPVSNLLSQRVAKAFRTQDASAQTVVFDLGTAQNVNTIAIIGHNLTASATLTIEANAADSWGSPSVSTSLTYIDGPIIKYLSSSESYRYWRLSIDDATNTDGYISLGVVWLGEYLTIDPASLLNFSVTKVRDDTVVYGRGRQKYASVGVGWRRFDLSFPRTGGTMLTSIQTMYDTVGNHTSCIFANFDDLRTYPLVEPVYCSIVGDLDFNHSSRMQFEYSLVLEEDK